MPRRASRRRSAAFISAVGIGMRLRKLWGLRGGVALCLALSTLAAVWSVQRVSVSPPRLTPRSLEMATASTHAVVDTPISAVLDLRQDTYSFEGLRNRAVLLGNVIAGSTVREAIARRANVPVTRLRIQAPLTLEQAAAPPESGNERHTSDILRSNDQYRLNIQANLSVPMLDIYAQAPTAKSAAVLANAAVDELRVYLRHLAADQRTPARDRIRLLQLGQAHGTVINEGVRWEMFVLAFVVTFALTCASVLFIARVRAGWRQQALAERAASA
jgi:hypothetical protein